MVVWSVWWYGRYGGMVGMVGMCLKQSDGEVHAHPLQDTSFSISISISISIHSFLTRIHLRR